MSHLFRLEEVESVSSTSSVLAERVRKGRARPGDALLAHEQTAGRGRSGGNWTSPIDAGVYLSVVLEAPGLDAPGVLPLALGLALVRELERVCGMGLLVKWPNDLHAPWAAPGGHVGKGDIRPGKLAGILCEIERPPAGAPAVVVAGLGVNLRETPTLPPGAVSLESLAGHPLDRGAVVDRILVALSPLAEGLPARLDEETRARLEARSLLRGRRIELSAGVGATVRGRVLGLAPDGALRVRTPSGVRHVHGGSVRLLPDVTSGERDATRD